MRYYEDYFFRVTQRLGEKAINQQAHELTIRSVISRNTVISYFVHDGFFMQNGKKCVLKLLLKVV